MAKGGFIRRAFSKENLLMFIGGVVGGFADDFVDKSAEKVPMIARVPIKLVIAGVALPMGNIGRGFGIVTGANALNDLVGKAKQGGKIS